MHFYSRPYSHPFSISSSTCTHPPAQVLDYLDIVVMIVFLLEAVLKVLAEGSAPFRYFGDSWNIFDMFIVSVGFLPFDTGESNPGQG